MKQFLITIVSLALSSTCIAQDLLQTHKDLPCVNKEYALMLHVAVDTNYNTNLDFQGAVDAANRQFAPICVSFNVCEIFVIKNYNYDSIGNIQEYNEFAKAYGVDNRINVYLFESHYDSTFCAVSSIHMLKSCTGSLAHELGHYFGLPHTFAGNGTELADGSNCETAGDGICDTPGDPFVPGDPFSEYVNDDCEFISLKTDANGQYYQPDVGNIMSYYPCSCGFTYDQYIRMANSARSGNSKLW